MDLQDWAALATIVGVLSIPVSGFFIWLQLAQQTRLARAANAKAITEMAAELNLALVQDRQLAEYWVRGAAEYDNYDDIDRYRFRNLLFWWLMMFENVFIQWQSGLLDHLVWQTWSRELQGMHEHLLASHWDELKINLHPGFVAYVERLKPVEDKVPVGT